MADSSEGALSLDVYPVDLYNLKPAKNCLFLLSEENVNTVLETALLGVAEGGAGTD